MSCVVIVDDVPASVRLIEMVLRADGYDVISVDTPDKVFDLFRTRKVDLLIADHNMPGMTGEQVLERIGTLWPQTRRLMLTADPRMRDAGGQQYAVMFKPFKLNELRDAVKQLLGPQ